MTAELSAPRRFIPGNRSLRLLGLGLLTLVVIGALWPAFPVHASWFRAILAGIGIFLLPGYLLRLLFVGDLAYAWPSRLALDFALSVGVATLAWLAATWSSGTLQTFAILLIALLLVELGLAAFRSRQSAPRPWRLGEFGGWPTVLALAVAGFWAVIALSQGALFMPETDNWYYLAGVRRIADTGLLAPGDPYFVGLPDPARGGPWLAMVALTARLGGVFPAALWDALPVLLIPAAVFCNFLLAETLFSDRWAAVLSCGFLLYGFGRFTWDVPMMVVTPGGVAFMLFLAACALSWLYLEKRLRPALPLALLLVAAMAANHLLVAAAYLVLLGAYAVLHAILRRDGGYLGHAALLAAGALVLLWVFAGNWFGVSLDSTNATFATEEWDVVSRVAGWRFIKPSALIGSGPSPSALAFLMAPLLLLLAKNKAWAIWLLASMLAVLLTAFNPMFVESAIRLGSLPAWAVWRMGLQLFQFQFVLGIMGILAIRWWIAAGHRAWGWSPGLSLVILALVGGVSLIPSSVPLLRPLWGYVGASAQTLSGAQLRLRAQVAGELAPILPVLPPGATVLTDANTAYYLSALSDLFVVAIPYGHSSPGVSDDDQRRAAVAAVLNPETSQQQTLAVLDRYRAGYVLLALPPAPHGKHSLSAERYAALRARFEAENAPFERLAADDQYALYRYVQAP